VILSLRKGLRAVKKSFLAKARLGHDRAWEFVKAADCYRQIRAAEDCPRSGPALVRDILTWLISYKMLPVHYGRCRLWEVERKNWKYYFGSNYRPHHEARLSQFVQPTGYRILFNDKYVCVLLCVALGIRVPRTYGVLDPSGDIRAELESWLGEADGKRLILKPLAGQSGRDIVLAERRGSETVIRTAKSIVPLGQYVLREKAIVQDVLSQHPAMAALSPASVNTVRVVTLVTPQNEIILVNAALRMGVGSAFVDNWSAGGVAAGVDCGTGRLKKFAFDKKGHRYIAHPTSGIVFEGHPLPGWDRIRAAAISIQGDMSFYRMLGFDVALDPGGEPVIVEINHSPDFTFLEQTGGPVLRIEPVLRAFGEYNLLVNRHQRKLYTRLSRF
jgi:hypothetical protein